MLICVIPEYEELVYRQKWLSDVHTMSYNQRYGGTIDFPQEKWKDWYQRWINKDGKFYAYVYSQELNEYVGEIAYHYDDNVHEIIANVIIDSKYRHLGFGRKALRLLCEKAKENGYDAICDEIDINNTAIHLFMNEGFKELFRNDTMIFVKKEL